MSEDEIGDVPRREKLHALFDVAKFNPKFTILIVVLGLGAAVLEGIGLGFILPIIEIVQTENPAAEADGVLGVFVTAYQALGIPFTLKFVIVGVALVMTIRYTLSFMVAWFREALRTYYIRNLQIRAFDNALGAKVEFYDQEGSDDILNAIIIHTSVTLDGITPSYDVSQIRSPISSETQANGVPINGIDIDELWDGFTIAREHRRNYLMST